MNKKNHLTADKKVIILRELLDNKVPAGELAEQYGIRINDIYRWKKAFEFRKHWLVYKQKNCPVCASKIIRTTMGKNKRYTYFCGHCQIIYLTKSNGLYLAI